MERNATTEFTMARLTNERIAELAMGAAINTIIEKLGLNEMSQAGRRDLVVAAEEAIEALTTAFATKYNV
jgi:hypothetical protein